MLYFPATRINLSRERPVASGEMVTAEGAAMVFDLAAQGVKQSTGVAGEQFIGASIAQQLTPAYLPRVETLVVGASVANTVTLAETPVGGTLFILDQTSGVVQAAGTPATTANEYSIAGKVVTFNAAQNGDTMYIAYRYAPTVLQIQNMQGMIPAGGSASIFLNSIGLVTNGEIWTTEYDTSVNWNAPTSVNLSAGGKFTIGGVGSAIDAVVTHVPTDSLPYLGLEIRA